MLPSTPIPLPGAGASLECQPESDVGPHPQGLDLWRQASISGPWLVLLTVTGVVSVPGRV